MFSSLILDLTNFTTGSRRSFELSYALPESWHCGTVTLEQGEVIHLRGEMLNAADVVEVTVQGDCKITAVCSRCLTQVTRTFSIDECYYFVWDITHGSPRKLDSYSNSGKKSSKKNKVRGKFTPQVVTLSEEEKQEYDYLVEELKINLETPLRDTIFTSLPLNPLCKPDCLGLCSHCGIRLEEAPADHRHDPPPNAFAPLKDLFC